MAVPCRPAPSRRYFTAVGSLSGLVGDGRAAAIIIRGPGPVIMNSVRYRRGGQTFDLLRQEG